MKQLEHHVELHKTNHHRALALCIIVFELTPPPNHQQQHQPKPLTLPFTLQPPTPIGVPGGDIVTFLLGEGGGVGGY